MKTTILQLVFLNHLDDIEWKSLEGLRHYFKNSANLYQFMERLTAEGLVETKKIIALRSNNRPTLMTVYRLSAKGLTLLKESKVYLLREVISDQGGVCV